MWRASKRERAASEKEGDQKNEKAGQRERDEKEKRKKLDPLRLELYSTRQRPPLHSPSLVEEEIRRKREAPNRLICWAKTSLTTNGNKEIPLLSLNLPPQGLVDFSLSLSLSLPGQPTKQRSTEAFRRCAGEKGIGTG
jgi:hypothetical protein